MTTAADASEMSVFSMLLETCRLNSRKGLGRSRVADVRRSLTTARVAVPSLCRDRRGLRGLRGRRDRPFPRRAARR